MVILEALALGDAILGVIFQSIESIKMPILPAIYSIHTAPVT
jgi:hypothetical protein